MKPALAVCCICVAIQAMAQTPQARTPYQTVADSLFAASLRSGKAYVILSELITTVGNRVSGSPQADAAVAWGKRAMERAGLENVRTERVMVPHWVRGATESAVIVSPRPARLRICALGGSIGTRPDGITAEVVEVKSFDELRALGSLAQGKIVFFNRPLDRARINTFEAYGGAVNQRGAGAVEAARAGGVAALVRSMTTRIDTVPHTGAMGYNDTVPKVPAAAIATADADMLSELLRNAESVKITLRLSAETLPDVESANVLGELTGSEKPEEVIVIGGHLDSWDKGQGAHDDGSGCAQSIEALRLLNDLGFRPKRTIRAVLFMNEENGGRGGKAYAAQARPGERHIAAMETDAGGFSPRGFGISADSTTFDRIAGWSSLFAPIEADRFRRGGGGADISELGRAGVPTIGLRVDGQRYFDYHHSDLDTIDKVNERELELGAASLALLAYLIAQEGL